MCGSLGGNCAHYKFLGGGCDTVQCGVNLLTFWGTYFTSMKMEVVQSLEHQYMSPRHHIPSRYVDTFKI